jgi:hypothetical protein
LFLVIFYLSPWEISYMIFPVSFVSMNKQR